MRLKTSVHYPYVNDIINGNLSRIISVVDVKSYPVIIEQDETGFVVSCPVFKGCYSQGNTIDEASKNIKEAIELCIDDEENPVSSIIVGNVVLER